ncbi:MAG: hypothetical protein ACRCYS_05980 [Beijerinckiaceae bacterium]
MRDWSEVVLVMMASVPKWLKTTLASIVMAWFCVMAILVSSGAVPWVDETIRSYVERIQGSATKIENAVAVMESVVTRVESVEIKQAEQDTKITFLGERLANTEHHLGELQKEDWLRATKVKAKKK